MKTWVDLNELAEGVRTLMGDRDDAVELIRNWKSQTTAGAKISRERESMEIDENNGGGWK
jgi:hypothetical protein